MLKKEILFLLVCFLENGLAITCDQKPDPILGEASSGRSNFHIVIASNPERYIPGKVYNVTLEGKNSVVQEPNLFNGFTLTVEPKKDFDYNPTDPLKAGIFYIIPDDSNTKINEKCPNTVTQTSHTFVQNITVFWKAPPDSRCVLFKAAVMEQNVWYKNGGGLTLELCEDDLVKSNQTEERCCSCLEAKYEMKFEGLWTRQNHPNHFPTNVWLTRFSDVIGASHAPKYRIWADGTQASEGLKEFLVTESTTTLESEIKSNETRTVIKAKGLRHPNITGKTFAVFRMDAEHHLLSLISLILPSPDWFVGLSGLELCDKSCEWIAEKTIELYPYDMGLYGDVSYTSRNHSTADPIKKIEDVNYESPFSTSATEKPKPLARVYLNRTRTYETAKCPNEKSNEPTEDRTNTDNTFSGYPEREDSSERGREPDTPPNICTGPSCDGNREPTVTVSPEKSCEDFPWSEMSACSLPECDFERVRGRFKQLPSEEMRQSCLDKNITLEAINEGCSPSCTPVMQNTAYTAHKLVLGGDCRVSQWTPFSPCDALCVRRRKRKLIEKNHNPLDRKCSYPIYEQTIPCSKTCIPQTKQNR